MVSMMCRRSSATPLLLIVLAMTMISCGGDDDSSSPSPVLQPIFTTTTLPSYLQVLRRDCDEPTLLGCLSQKGAAIDHAARDPAVFDINEALAALDLDRPPVEFAVSEQAFARCLAGSEGNTVCIPRLTPTAVCSPFPTDVASLLGLVTDSGVVRDGYRVLEPGADPNEVTAEIMIDRFCDLLQRNEEQGTRLVQEDELGLTDDVVRSWADDLDNGIDDATRFVADMDRPPFQLSDDAIRQLDGQIRAFDVAADPAVRRLSSVHCRIVKAWKVRVPVCA